MSHSFEHRIYGPVDGSPADLATTTHTTVTRWGVHASQARVVSARVRTLATLLTACEASEFHLRLYYASGRVRVEVTTPTGALFHDLPAWQTQRDQTHTRYTTSAQAQRETGVATKSGRLLTSTPCDERRSA
jgi:hypothetical protein